MTPLDLAHADITARPLDDAARLRFYGLLADAELIVLVSGESGEAALTPRQFDLEDGPVILVFDTEDRLTDFTGEVAPYLAMPGRLVMGQLAGQGVGLGLNLGVAPSAILLPPQVVDWLAETVSSAADYVVAARPVQFHPPVDFPLTTLAALDRSFDRIAGMADYALLSLAENGQCQTRPLLAVIGADPARHDVLARMISETVAFSGQPDWMPDVVFLGDADTLVASMVDVAHRFDMPTKNPTAPNSAPAAPGMDPARPPILR
jgi:hypothetical protein